MADLELTQQEGDRLIAVPKVRIDAKEATFPDLGGRIKLDLKSEDGRDRFHMDVRKGRAELSCGTYQNRTQSSVILIRVDLGGKPHRNPDGELIVGPHLHEYREGYMDKWARPLPEDFTDPEDMWLTFEQFMDFIHVIERPNIQQGLFS